ncbi:MAG: nucleotide exchange factor GrpE [Alphaproteobacteria bacterium]|nr:nucleotide exchange factor GrpE [Alphaproteobacteria bacterium]
MTQKNDPAAAAPENPAQPPAPIPEEEIARLAEEAAHWKELALRAHADMENLRKRTQADVEAAHKYAAGAVARELLPVVDSLENARAHARTALADGASDKAFLDNLLQGVEMTHRQFLDALKKQGVEQESALGKIFDPHKHKVIQEIEDKTKPAGTIVQELQKGYAIGGDRVLREALVVVSK